MFGRLASPVNWSRKRKVAVVVLALIMTYLHSFYILGFYVSHMEYWGTVWMWVTPEQRLLSFVLGLGANIGLLATPFLRAPGPILRALLTLSLAAGLALSVAWLVRDLWVMGLPDLQLPELSKPFIYTIIDIQFLN